MLDAEKISVHMIVHIKRFTWKFFDIIYEQLKKIWIQLKYILL